MNGEIAPHMRLLRRWPQWLCALFGGHLDRNYSNGRWHYAFCARCGRLFGNIWLRGPIRGESLPREYTLDDPGIPG